MFAKVHFCMLFFLQNNLTFWLFYTCTGSILVPFAATICVMLIMILATIAVIVFLKRRQQTRNNYIHINDE